MTPRRGFVLAAVLCVLVLMAMLVAISAQRALLAARQGTLDGVGVDLAIVLASGETSALESVVDSAAVAAQPAGVALATGAAEHGAASVRWTIMSTATPFAILDLAAEAPALHGRARQTRRAVLQAVRDSSGIVCWVFTREIGRVRLVSR